MRQFLVVAVFAAVLSPDPSLGLGGLSFSSLPSSRSFDLHELCEWFCRDHDYDYLFRTLDKSVSPRFLCGLCDKKYTSTTTTPTRTTTTTTSTSTTPPPTTSPTTTPTPTTMSSSETPTPTTSTENATSSTQETTTPGMG